jgi:preprotein translocase subunit SecA
MVAWWYSKANKIWLRILALVVSSVFFFTQVVGASVPDRSFWAERRKAKQKLLASREKPRQSERRKDLGKKLEEKDVAGEVSSLITPHNLFTVPSQYGTVKEVHTQATSKKPQVIGNRLIIHIQDAHSSPEAQLNSANILKYLQKGVARESTLPLLICVEGSSGVVDTTLLSSFPEKKIKEEVASEFLKEGKITGEEYFAITGGEKAPAVNIYGVEDKWAYKKNLKAFDQGLSSGERLRNYFQKVRKEINLLKARLYNKRLKGLESKIEAYQKKIISLTQYSQYLYHLLDDTGSMNRTPTESDVGTTLLGRPERQSDRLALSGATKDARGTAQSPSPARAKYPNFELFVQASKFEDKIDFSKVDSERSKYIKELSKKLTNDELSDLLIMSLDYRLGKVTSAEYYTYLQSLSSRMGKGVRSQDPRILTELVTSKEGKSEYPNLNLYIKYNKLYDRIDQNRLFSEISELQEEVKERLCQREEERELIKLSRMLGVLEDLTSLKISNEDLAYYYKHRDEITPGMFSNFITAHSVRGRKGDVAAERSSAKWVVAGFSLRPATLPKFEEFYRVALNRNKALVDNTISRMEKEGVRVTVLIAGGFHTPGITELLRDRNISYVVVTPRLGEDYSSDLKLPPRKKRTDFEKAIAGIIGALRATTLLGDKSFQTCSVIHLNGRTLILYSQFEPREIQNAFNKLGEQWQSELADRPELGKVIDNVEFLPVVLTKGREAFALGTATAGNKNLPFVFRYNPVQKKVSVIHGKEKCKEFIHSGSFDNAQEVGQVVCSELQKLWNLSGADKENIAAAFGIAQPQARKQETVGTEAAKSVSSGKVRPSGGLISRRDFLAKVAASIAVALNLGPLAKKLKSAPAPRDHRATKPRGVIYIDNIFFSKGARGLARPTFFTRNIATLLALGLGAILFIPFILVSAPIVGLTALVGIPALTFLGFDIPTRLYQGMYDNWLKGRNVKSPGLTQREMEERVERILRSRLQSDLEYEIVDNNEETLNGKPIVLFAGKILISENVAQTRWDWQLAWALAHEIGESNQPDGLNESTRERRANLYAFFKVMPLYLASISIQKAIGKKFSRVAPKAPRADSMRSSMEDKVGAFIAESKIIEFVEKLIAYYGRGKNAFEDEWSSMQSEIEEHNKHSRYKIEIARNSFTQREGNVTVVQAKINGRPVTITEKTGKNETDTEVIVDEARVIYRENDAAGWDHSFASYEITIDRGHLNELLQLPVNLPAYMRFLTKTHGLVTETEKMETLVRLLGEKGLLADVIKENPHLILNSAVKVVVEKPVAVIGMGHIIEDISAPGLFIGEDENYCYGITTGHHLDKESKNLRVDINGIVLDGGFCASGAPVRDCVLFKISKDEIRKKKAQVVLVPLQEHLPGKQEQEIPALSVGFPSRRDQQKSMALGISSIKALREGFLPLERYVERVIIRAPLGDGFSGAPILSLPEGKCLGMIFRGREQSTFSQHVAISADELKKWILEIASKELNTSIRFPDSVRVVGVPASASLAVFCRSVAERFAAGLKAIGSAFTFPHSPIAAFTLRLQKAGPADESALAKKRLRIVKLASVSLGHFVNNSLVTVRLAAELAQDAPGDLEALKEYTEYIVQDADQTAGLIRDFYEAKRILETTYKDSSMMLHIKNLAIKQSPSQKEAQSQAAELTTLEALKLTLKKAWEGEVGIKRKQGKAEVHLSKIEESVRNIQELLSADLSLRQNQEEIVKHLSAIEKSCSKISQILEKANNIEQVTFLQTAEGPMIKLAKKGQVGAMFSRIWSVAERLIKKFQKKPVRFNKDLGAMFRGIWSVAERMIAEFQKKPVGLTEEQQGKMVDALAVVERYDPNMAKTLFRMFRRKRLIVVDNPEWIQEGTEQDNWVFTWVGEFIFDKKTGIQKDGFDNLSAEQLAELIFHAFKEREALKRVKSVEKAHALALKAQAEFREKLHIPDDESLEVALNRLVARRRIEKVTRAKRIVAGLSRNIDLYVDKLEGLLALGLPLVASYLYYSRTTLERRVKSLEKIGFSNKEITPSLVRLQGYVEVPEDSPRYRNAQKALVNLQKKDAALYERLTSPTRPKKIEQKSKEKSKQKRAASAVGGRRIITGAVSKRSNRKKFIKNNLSEVDNMEGWARGLSDTQLRLSISQFKDEISELKSPQEKEARLDEILPQVFAMVREAARRKLNIQHRDVQVEAGIALHSGMAVDEKTGEGKTLVAGLPACLNALAGRVDVQTTTDEYAREQVLTMSRVYLPLGFKVGLLKSGVNYGYVVEMGAEDEPVLRITDKAEVYRSDIVYGINSEFGFDYMRDNTVTSVSEQIQNGLHYAIVDEADSILIDEARTPMIISLPDANFAEHRKAVELANDAVIRIKKQKKFYAIDEKNRTVSLTAKGMRRVEELTGISHLYGKEQEEEQTDTYHQMLRHCISQALYAHLILERGKDYLVEQRGKEIVLIDSFTGDTLPGRSYTGNLQQAVEAKEELEISAEGETVASISFRGFYGKYAKLAGMSGTAEGGRKSFEKIYGLPVYVVSTNTPVNRIDYPDSIHANRGLRNTAVITKIMEIHQSGRPVLAGGNVSVGEARTFAEKFSRKSGLLWVRGKELERLLENAKRARETGKKFHLSENIFVVLNAENKEQLEGIINIAGQKGMVTIATNLAGRSADIRLGEGVGESGGLWCVGISRSESRRVDEQFSGRAGRQGLPGSSQFFVSMEDRLLRKFGGSHYQDVIRRLEKERKIRVKRDKEDNIMEINPLGRFSLSDEEIVEFRAIVENAQKRAEEVNQERLVESCKWEALKDGQWNRVEALRQDLLEGRVPEILQPVYDALLATAKESVSGYTEQEVTFLVRKALISTIDSAWQEEIESLDSLRHGIEMGSREKPEWDPYDEYCMRAQRLFFEMIEWVKVQAEERLTELLDVGKEKAQEEMGKDKVVLPADFAKPAQRIEGWEEAVEELSKIVASFLKKSLPGEPLYAGGLAGLTQRIVNSILTVTILENRYFSKQENRISLVQNAAGLLTQDIETISSKLGDLGITIDFLTNPRLCEEYLNLQDGRLSIKKVQEVIDIIRPPPEESVVALAEKVLRKDGRVLNGGFPGGEIDYGEVEINGKKLLIVKLGKNSTERWKDKKLRTHFQKFINNRRRGEMSGAVIVLQPEAEPEGLRIPVYYIQKSLQKITASVLACQNYQDSKLEQVNINRLSVFERISYFFQKLRNSFNNIFLGIRRHSIKTTSVSRHIIEETFSSRPQQRKRLKIAAGIGVFIALSSIANFAHAKEGVTRSFSQAGFINLLRTEQQEMVTATEEYKQGKITTVDYYREQKDIYEQTLKEVEQLKAKNVPIVIRDKDGREKRVDLARLEMDLRKQIQEIASWISGLVEVTPQGIPEVTQETEVIPEVEPTEAISVDEKTEKQEDKTEKIVIQLEQRKPEKGPKEAKGSQQETEQAPLVKEVSAERASEEELLDKLSEVLSHTRYKRWADVNARVSIVRRIEQVNKGERNSVKMSFHSRGEYRRTVDALKGLEEIGFIRLRLADVPEGRPAGEILNAIFAGYKLEILPPAAVVPSGESLLSEPESGEEVVVAEEEIAESTRAEATKAKYNFAKVRDLLALGIYNRFIPALPEEKAKVLEEVLEKWKEATDPAKNLDVLIVEKLNEIAKDNDGLRVWAKGGLETYRCWFVAIGIEFPIVDKTRPVREMIGEGQNILAQVEHINRINNFRSWVERALDTYRGQRMAVERQKREVESWQAALTRATSRKDRQVEDRVKEIESKLLEAEAGLVLAEKNAALAKNELGRLLEISPQEGFELSKDLLEITTAKIEEELKELKEMAGEIGIVGTDDASRTFPGQIQAVRNALESLNNKYKEVNGAWSNIRFRGELSYSALFQFYQSDLGLIFSRGEKYSPMALMHLREAMVYGNEATLRDIKDGLDRAEQAVKNTERLQSESLTLANKAEEYLKKARQATEKGYLSWQDLIRANELLREARESKGNSLMAYAAAARTYDELNKGWSEVDKIEDFCNRVEEFVRKDKKELTKEEKRVQKEIISTMKWLLGEIKKDKKLIDRYENNPDWKYAIGYIQQDHNLKVNELKDLKETLEASLPRDSKKEKKLRDEIGGLKELAVESKVTEKVEPEKGTAASYVSNSLKENPRLKQRRNKTQARKWQYRRFLREVNGKFFLFKLIDGIFGMETGTISTVGGRLEGSIKLGREDACKLKLYEKLTILAEAEEKLAEAGLAEEARNAYLNWIRSEAQRGLFLRDIKVIDNHIELKKELLMKTKDAKFEHQIADLELEKSRLEELVAQLKIRRDGAKQRYAQVVGIKPEEIKSEALNKIARISELSARNREFFDLFSEFQKELDKEIHNFTMLKLNTYEATLNYLEADVEVQKALRDLAKAGFKVKWDATLGHTGGFGQQIGTGALWFGQELFNFTKIADRKGEVARAEAAVEKAEEPLRFIRKFYRNEAALRKALIGLADKRSGLSWESLGSSIDSLNKTTSEAEKKISRKSKEDVLVEERKVLAARRDVISSIIDTWGLLSTYIPTTEGEEVETIDIDKIENEGDIRSLIEKAVDEMWSEARANRDLAKRLEDIRQYWWAGPFSGYLMETATHVYDYPTVLVPVPGTDWCGLIG